MRRLASTVLCALAVSAMWVPAAASGAPIHDPPQSAAAGRHQRAARDDSATLRGALIVLSGVVAGGVLLRRVPRRRGSARPLAASAPATTPAQVPDPSPALPAEPAPPLTPVARTEAALSSAATRYVLLYDAEYAKQLVRTQRLRKTVMARLAPNGTSLPSD
jgi:hypothetical protein